LSPDGALIAVGTDGDFIGSSIESAAYVMGSATAEELFRKYFPRRSWIKVAFLGNDRLAYSASPQGPLIFGSEFKVVHVTAQR
jgi:type II secretory pathway component PulL